MNLNPFFSKVTNKNEYTIFVFSSLAYAVEKIKNTLKKNDLSNSEILYIYLPFLKTLSCGRTAWRETSWYTIYWVLSLKRQGIAGLWPNGQ